MKTISRKQITERLYNRFGGAIPKSMVFNGVSIIIDILADKFKKEENVYIKNFGTFVPCIRFVPPINHLGTGAPEPEPFKYVHFAIHKTFKKLLTERQKE